MIPIAGIRTARLTGLLLGASLALALLWVSRPAADSRTVGASVSFFANPTGEVAVEPIGPTPFLKESAMKPGDSVAGSFTLTNQATALHVRLRAVGSEPSLDNDLTVDLRSNGRVLASGPLGSLGRRSATALDLAPGESRVVLVTATLDRDAGTATGAALVDVGILFDPVQASPRSGSKAASG